MRKRFWQAGIVFMLMISLGCRAAGDLPQDGAGEGHGEGHRENATETAASPFPQDGGAMPESPDPLASGDSNADGLDDAADGSPAPEPEMLPEEAPGEPADTPPDSNPADTPEQPDPSLMSKKHNLPDGFVYVDDHIPGILLDIRYYGEDNFVGARVDGYNGPYAILAVEAADALARVQADLSAQGLTLLIYDAYRPQKAVDHFKAWSEDPGDTRTKADYYPDLDKSRLFKLGYIASRSGHSRGATVDLTVADAATGEPLDMGTPHDFLGEESHHGSPLVTEEQAANRLLLKEKMERRGFKAYSKEWWHYTLIDEPYPDTYFDFDVE